VETGGALSKRPPDGFSTTSDVGPGCARRRADRILSLEDDVVDFAAAFDEIAASADAAWLA
jgi:hypothetical protein